MKNTLRLIVAGTFLATFSSVFGATESRETVALSQPARLESGQMIVTQKAGFSPQDLAKYKKRQQVAKEETQQQAAGEGMDKTTMVIIGVLAVVVIVAVASGGGGGGGGY